MRIRLKGGYNIDTFDDGTNCCLIDSVGSQANRIEPLFALEKYAGLTPQVTIKAGEKIVNLLEAGHRAGDAIVRCTPLQEVLRYAFKAAQQGDAEPLAKIAPTSLIFGVWDSRDTQAKLPRLIASTIRAFNVKRLTRSAQFVPATEYVESTLLEDPDSLGDSREEKEQKTKLRKAYAERGFIHVPASGSHGGIIATGGIRRDATLSLAALRLLNVKADNGGVDKNRTESLRRYILGLALVAFTYRQPSYLRQGCNLVPDPDKPAEFVEVWNDGSRHPAKITHDEALAYAKKATVPFLNPDRKIEIKPIQIVDESRPADFQVEFDKELAKRDVQGEAEGDGSAKPRRKKAK